MSAKPNMSVPAPRSDAPLSRISFGNPDVSIDRRSDGTIYLRPKMPLGEYPDRLTDRLHHWAKVEPNRLFMAEREAGGSRRQNTHAPLAGSRRGRASRPIPPRLAPERAGGTRPASSTGAR